MINYQKGIIWVKNFFDPRRIHKNTWKKVLEEEQEQREALEKKLRRSK
jgi:hypothetical protein